MPLSHPSDYRIRRAARRRGEDEELESGGSTQGGYYESRGSDDAKYGFAHSRANATQADQRAARDSVQSASSEPTAHEYFLAGLRSGGIVAYETKQRIGPKQVQWHRKDDDTWYVADVTRPGGFNYLDAEFRQGRAADPRKLLAGRKKPEPEPAKVQAPAPAGQTPQSGGTPYGEYRGTVYHSKDEYEAAIQRDIWHVAGSLESRGLGDLWWHTTRKAGNIRTGRGARTIRTRRYTHTGPEDDPEYQTYLALHDIYRQRNKMSAEFMGISLLEHAKKYDPTNPWVRYEGWDVGLKNKRSRETGHKVPWPSGLRAPSGGVKSSAQNRYALSAWEGLYAGRTIMEINDKNIRNAWNRRQSQRRAISISAAAGLPPQEKPPIMVSQEGVDILNKAAAHKGTAPIPNTVGPGSLVGPPKVSAPEPEPEPSGFGIKAASKPDDIERILSVKPEERPLEKILSAKPGVVSGDMQGPPLPPEPDPLGGIKDMFAQPAPTIDQFVEPEPQGPSPSLVPGELKPGPTLEQFADNAKPYKSDVLEAVIQDRKPFGVGVKSEGIQPFAVGVTSAVTGAAVDAYALAAGARELVATGDAERAAKRMSDVAGGYRTPSPIDYLSSKIMGYMDWGGHVPGIRKEPMQDDNVDWYEGSGLLENPSWVAGASVGDIATGLIALPGKAALGFRSLGKIKVGAGQKDYVDMGTGWFAGERLVLSKHGIGQRAALRKMPSDIIPDTEVDFHRGVKLAAKPQPWLQQAYGREEIISRMDVGEESRDLLRTLYKAEELTKGWETPPARYDLGKEPISELRHSEAEQLIAAVAGIQGKRLNRIEPIGGSVSQRVYIPDEWNRPAGDIDIHLKSKSKAVSLAKDVADKVKMEAVSGPGDGQPLRILDELKMSEPGQPARGQPLRILDELKMSEPGQPARVPEPNPPARKLVADGGKIELVDETGKRHKKVEFLSEDDTDLEKSGSMLPPTEGRLFGIKEPQRVEKLKGGLKVGDLESQGMHKGESIASVQKGKDGDYVGPAPFREKDITDYYVIKKTQAFAMKQAGNPNADRLDALMEGYRKNIASQKRFGFDVAERARQAQKLDVEVRIPDGTGMQRIGRTLSASARRGSARSARSTSARSGLSMRESPASARSGLSMRESPASARSGLSMRDSPASARSASAGSGRSGRIGISPGYGSPGYGSPGYGSPGYGSPGYGSPGYGSPGYGSPGGGSPGKSPVQTPTRGSPTTRKPTVATKLPFPSQREEVSDRVGKPRPIKPFANNTFKDLFIGFTGQSDVGYGRKQKSVRDLKRMPKPSGGNRMLGVRPSGRVTKDIRTKRKSIGKSGRNALRI